MLRVSLTLSIILILVTLRPVVVDAHGEYAWIMGYQTGFGQSCCGYTDAVVIPHEVAGPARIGSKIVAYFHGVPVQVVVNAIYPTEDPEGRSWITRYGCLFKMFGV